MTGAQPGFDRVRPRTVGSAEHPVASPPPGSGDEAMRPVDREGKRALYSDVTAPPATGALAVECEGCGQRSVVSWLSAGRLALPGLVLPVPGRGTRAWLRCPACRRRHWVRVSFRA